MFNTKAIVPYSIILKSVLFSFAASSTFIMLNNLLAKILIHKINSRTGNTAYCLIYSFVFDS